MRFRSRSSLHTTEIEKPASNPSTYSLGLAAVHGKNQETPQAGYSRSTTMITNAFTPFSTGTILQSAGFSQSTSRTKRAYLLHHSTDATKKPAPNGSSRSIIVTLTHSPQLFSGNPRIQAGSCRFSAAMNRRSIRPSFRIGMILKKALADSSLSQSYLAENGKQTRMKNRGFLSRGSWVVVQTLLAQKRANGPSRSSIATSILSRPSSTDGTAADQIPPTHILQLALQA